MLSPPSSTEKRHLWFRVSRVRVRGLGFRVDTERLNPFNPKPAQIDAELGECKPQLLSCSAVGAHSKTWVQGSG